MVTGATPTTTPCGGAWQRLSASSYGSYHDVKQSSRDAQDYPEANERLGVDNGGRR
jgi:hypothetical protein